MQQLIKGYPDYSISTLGVVTDSSGNARNTYLTDGYKQVSLKKDGKHHLLYVHRLVAEAFIPNPENKPQVNHIDSDRTNNCVSNLEWVTNKENAVHGATFGNMQTSSNLGVKKANSTSKYFNVTYSSSKDCYSAQVYNPATKKNLKKSFSCRVHKDAEVKAALVVNKFLDEIGDTTRPRNTV